LRRVSTFGLCLPPGAARLSPALAAGFFVGKRSHEGKLPPVMYTRKIYRAAWALVREYSPEHAPRKAAKRLQSDNVRRHALAGGSPIWQLIARCFGWYRANPPGEPKEMLVVWNDALEKWFHGKRAWNSAALYSLRNGRRRR
jgi:hypothetical protein